jgi:hypothetical protein
VLKTARSGYAHCEAGRNLLLPGRIAAQASTLDDCRVMLSATRADCPFAPNEVKKGVTPARVFVNTLDDQNPVGAASMRSKSTLSNYGRF